MAVYLVTGTNRGIGLELTRQVLAQGHEVIATARAPGKVDELIALANQYQGLTLLPLDLADETTYHKLIESLAGRPIDVLINNAGIYGPRDAELGNLKASDWVNVLHIDAVAPLLLTQMLLPNLRAGAGRRVAFMSSKMGSIADNGSGGSYIYRSAKAALNAAVKSLALDLMLEQFIVLTLHPGWVRTDMGGPNGLIDAHTSVAGLLQVIQSARPVSSGCFLDYTGKEIPW